MFHMKCVPQSQTGCAGSRFLDNLCAQQYWNFKFLPQVCDVPVRDFSQNQYVLSPCILLWQGSLVFPPAWAMADALTFPWFLLDEPWCIEHMSSWKGWYPGVISGYKTGHQGKTSSRNTAWETSSAQSQHLFTYTGLCVHMGSFYSDDIQVKKY